MAGAARPDYRLAFSLYDILPDAILAVDQQGFIRYANRQAGLLFGQEPATLVSTRVEALLPEHLRERHIAHRAKFNLDPRRRPMGRGLDLVARRADGTTFRVDIMLNPLDYLAEPVTLAVVRDMTDFRALEDALRQARAAFEKFYEQPPDATILVDENGKIDRVNEAAEAMFGFSRERILGESIETLIPERFRDRHMAHRAHYMNDRKTRAMGVGLQLFARRADGSEFPVDIMLSPMEIDQRQLVLAMVRDITERKRAEAQVQWLMREVNHRAKNILSVVQAMAHQTGADEAFVSEFEERIRGLSASYDLLVNNKCIIVDFAREAESVDRAIVSAIECVKAAGATVERVEPDPLVNLSDIAARTGMTRAAMSQYSKGQRSKGFPAPVARVTSDSPLWDWATVARWLFQHDKLTREMAMEAEAVKAANAAIEARESQLSSVLQERLKAYEDSLEGDAA